MDSKYTKDLAYIAIIATVALTLNLTFNTTIINNTYNELKELQNITSQIQQTQDNNTRIANETIEYLDDIDAGIEKLNKRPYLIVTK